MGTANRNHCPFCLWSKHVDNQTGDRLADCHGNMQPIGLTFKHQGYGRQGEIMLIHECRRCHKLSINRIAADDDENEILAVFATRTKLDPATKQRLIDEHITLATDPDANEIHTQLFGAPRVATNKRG